MRVTGNSCRKPFALILFLCSRSFNPLLGLLLPFRPSRVTQTGLIENSDKAEDFLCSGIFRKRQFRLYIGYPLLFLILKQFLRTLSLYLRDVRELLEKF